LDLADTLALINASGDVRQAELAALCKMLDKERKEVADKRLFALRRDLTSLAAAKAFDEASAELIRQATPHREELAAIELAMIRVNEQFLKNAPRDASPDPREAKKALLAEWDRAAPALGAVDTFFRQAVEYWKSQDRKMEPASPPEKLEDLKKKFGEASTKLKDAIVEVDKNTGGLGKCAKAVNDALQQVGATTNDGNGDAHELPGYMAKHPDIFEELNVAEEDLDKLPAGAIIVWGRNDAVAKFKAGSASESEAEGERLSGLSGESGHIGISLGNGQQAYDGTSLTKAFANQPQYGYDFGGEKHTQRFRVFKLVEKIPEEKDGGKAEGRGKESALER
jgi:hypothetical protein